MLQVRSVLSVVLGLVMGRSLGPITSQSCRMSLRLPSFVLGYHVHECQSEGTLNDTDVPV